MCINITKSPLPFEPADYRQVNNLSRLDEVINEIKYLKMEISDLYETKKGITDQEVLSLAEKIDCLLNEYDRLLKLSYFPPSPV